MAILPGTHRRLLRTAALTARGLSLLLVAAVASAQPVPDIRVTGPRAVIGSDVELHRVRGAALLSNGRIAVADGGSARVIVFGPSGAIEKTFGRAGSGPGDFQMLYLLVGIGDTIVTWDSGLSRVTLWRPDGSIIRNVSLPAVADHVVAIQAIKSATEYIATLRTGSIRPANGLYLDTFAVISVNAITERPIELGRREWSYGYFYGEGRGTSTYATPFLGSTLVASSAGKLFTLPIGRNEIAVTRADGSAGRPIMLPIKREDARGRAQRYADSMIASIREKDRDPRWVRRIRSAFGADFPAAQPAVAQRAVAVGRSVWFQSFPEPQDSTATWFVIDAAKETLLGRLRLPKSAQVLGGNDRQVLVLLRDADGVETVGLFDVSIPR